MMFLPGLAHLALVCATLGEATHAEEIYDLLRPYVGRVVVVGAPAQACWGPVDHYLGILAALGGRPDWAAEHFEAALAHRRPPRRTGAAGRDAPRVRQPAAEHRRR